MLTLANSSRHVEKKLSIHSHQHIPVRMVLYARFPSYKNILSDNLKKELELKKTIAAVSIGIDKSVAEQEIAVIEAKIKKITLFA